MYIGEKHIRRSKGDKKEKKKNKKGASSSVQGKKGWKKEKREPTSTKPHQKGDENPGSDVPMTQGGRNIAKSAKTRKRKKHHAGDGINHVFSKQHSQLRHRAMETPLPSLSHYAQPTCDVVTGLHNCPYVVGISPRTRQALDPKIYYDTTRSLTSPEPVIRPGTDLTR